MTRPGKRARAGGIGPHVEREIEKSPTRERVRMCVRACEVKLGRMSILLVKHL